ncbi:hypothetical protein AB8P52_04275 [Companilactobacillus pabuli]|uniref:hypothetical protein n=1 Tax=Companilactobacillus pabuli TaxID=2714036 RepID=UPI003516C745
MTDITHGTWIKDGKAVDAVYQGGIKVYGRNLYTDTRNFDNLSAWAGSSYWNKTGEKFNGLTVMATDQDWNGLRKSIQTKKGETYTYSVYARYKSGTGTSAIVTGNNGANPNPNMSRVSLDTTWQRVSFTTSATADGYMDIGLVRFSLNENTLLIAGLKLEMVSVPTPWTQAPEDVM